MALKRELLCPRCDGRAVWHIAKMHERGEASAFEKPIQPLNVVLHEKFFKLYNGVGYFETYICRACGYTEWYAHGLDELQEDPEKGVFLLQGQPDDEGPYR